MAIFLSGQLRRVSRQTEQGNPNLRGIDGNLRKPHNHLYLEQAKGYVNALEKSTSQSSAMR